jgi:hypothetical protein
VLLRAEAPPEEALAEELDRDLNLGFSRPPEVDSPGWEWLVAGFSVF